MPTDGLNNGQAAVLTDSFLRKHTKEFDLESVYTLDITALNLVNLEPLESCPNILELNATGNLVETIDEDSLSGLLLIKKLTLKTNKIKNLGGLLKLHTLEHLQLQSNQISDLDQVLSLKALPNLKSLYLRNVDGTMSNPVCKVADYRLRVVQEIPQLLVLDGERLRATKMPSVEEVLADDGGGGQKFTLPPSMPWFQNFQFDDCFIDESKLLKERESEFKDILAECKKLVGQGQALLNDHRNTK